MASVLKMSLAFGLFGLVALAAILSWYFTYASGSSYNYSFAGTDDTGAQIRLVAKWDSWAGATKIDFEILDTSDPTSWKLFKSANNLAETDPWFGFYNINQGDSAWQCTKVGNGNQNGNTNGASTFKQLGVDLFNSMGNAGGLTYFSIGYTDSTGAWIQKVLIPVVFSSAGVTNFGGYQGTTTFGSATLAPFKSGLPSLPSYSACVDYVSDAASAVVESNSAPLCSSFPSLFAFLQQRSYANNAAASFCTGSSTAVTCTGTTTVSDTLLWSGKDRAFVCTSAVYGTIISFSGSDDAVDWLRNVQGNTVAFAGMSAHAGFYKKFSLWQSYVDANASAGQTTFNGHSLGGAVANIAAAYWKGKYPSATVNIVSCGAPAAFKSHTAQYNSITNKRYVNFKKNPWYLPNQRDVVSVVAGVLGFSHPSSAPILYNTKDGSSYNTNSISVTAVVGDVDVMGMHTTYTTSIDAARGSQSTF